MSSYDFVSDDITRAVLEGDLSTVEAIKHAAQNTENCCGMDVIFDDGDIPYEVLESRANAAYEVATYIKLEDYPKAVEWMRKYWDV